MEENTYIITVTDSATYAIRSTSRETAELAAQNYFDERKHTVLTEIDNSEMPELTI